MTTRQSGFAAPLLTATLIVGGGLSVASKGAMAAPVPSLSYLGIVELMATPGAMASPFPACPVGEGCTQSFDPTNSTETYDFNPTPTGTSFTQPSTTLNISSPLVSGGPVGNTFGGTMQFGTHPFSTFSASTAKGPSGFAIGGGMSAGSGQTFAFIDFITPQPTTAHPNGTPITVNISAQLSHLMSGSGGFTPTPANCAGIGGTTLNNAANITLTMVGGYFSNLPFVTIYPLSQRTAQSQLSSEHHSS